MNCCQIALSSPRFHFQLFLSLSLYFCILDCSYVMIYHCSEPQTSGHLFLGILCPLGFSQQRYWDPSASSRLRTLLRKPHFNQSSVHSSLTQLPPQTQDPTCSPESGQNGMVTPEINEEPTFTDKCTITLNVEYSQSNNISYLSGTCHTGHEVNSWQKMKKGPG